MKFPLVIFLIFLSGISYSQQKFELGGFGGVSYYHGDINSQKLFYAPQQSYGLKVNYTFTRRYSLNTSFYYGNFTASDLDFSNDYQRYIRQASFNASLLDVNMQFKFNFLPMDNTTRFKDNFTFFVSGGMGYTFFVKGTNYVKPHFTLPFGVGVEFCPIKRFSIGAEWSYRKTWQDGIDGVESIRTENYRSSIHNNDWYAYAGFFVVYRFFYKDWDCPVYW